ncbi:MAG: 3'-5' exonuclease [Leptospirales bacterium]|nr:3'-5' exonuclease [Leptospirales bacterium]
MNDFIAIDFETAAYSRDSAVSIGLVKYRNYRPIGSYYSLIRPPRLYIRPDFTDIHGLTVDDVRDAPDFDDIWESEIKGFIGTTILAAHNAAFDMGVLRAVLKYYDIPVPPISYFCSCKLSKKVWPVYKSHSLSNLAEKFGIVYDTHNALADAETCGKIITLCARDIDSASTEKSIKSEGMPLSKLLEEVNVKVKILGE